MDQNFTGYAIDRENRQSIEDNALPFLCAGTAEEARLPDVVDPEVWGLHVENQGMMNSCGGHASSTGAECLLYWEHNVNDQFSRLFAYYTGQQESGLFGQDVGMTIEGGIKAASEIGHIPESLLTYPNPVAYGGAHWTISAQQRETAAQYRIKSYVSMRKQADPWAASLDWLGNYGVIQMGIGWPANIDPHGVVRQWASGRNGHAIVAVGYVWDWLNPGRRLVKIANSHGLTYGKKGFLYMPEAVWRDCLRDPRTVAIGQTSLTSPRRNPRVWDGKRSLMVRYHKSLI